MNESKSSVEFEAATIPASVLSNVEGLSGGDLVSLSDVCRRVPSAGKARTQEGHILSGYIISRYRARMLGGSAVPISIEG